MRYVLLLLLCFATPASAQIFSPDSAWDWACAATSYDCRGVERPTFTLGMPYGLEHNRGGYADGVIYLNPKLYPGVDIQTTAIHEMVHHLQHVIAGHPSVADFGSPEMEQLCADEAEAFFITDMWLFKINLEGMIRGPFWWETYPHCYPYFQ